MVAFMGRAVSMLFDNPPWKVPKIQFCVRRVALDRELRGLLSDNPPSKNTRRAELQDVRSESTSCKPGNLRCLVHDAEGELHVVQGAHARTDARRGDHVRLLQHGLQGLVATARVPPHVGRLHAVFSRGPVGGK